MPFSWEAFCRMWVKSGTMMSTPGADSEGNISPASMRSISPRQARTMALSPISPKPPSGMTCSISHSIMDGGLAPPEYFEQALARLNTRLVAEAQVTLKS